MKRMNQLKQGVSVSVLAALLSAGSAYAAPQKDMKHSTTLKDDAYVTLSGTVGKITDGDEFELHYSNGTIMVDTNDYWPDLFRKDATQLLKTGDRIWVSGKVDDNLFTAKEIDAVGIRHDGKQYSRTYWSDTASANWLTFPDEYDDEIRLNGQISKVLSKDEFVLDYGSGSIQVETGDINFSNASSLKVGDQITVYGEIDDDWFEKKELEANRIYQTNYYPPLAKR